MTDADIQLIHHAVKVVAGNCDGARAVDGQGFNGGDAEFGRSLAHSPRLTPGQAQAALRMLPKYRRQLGDELAVKLADIMARQQTEAAAVKAKPLDADTVKTLLPWGPPRHVNARGGARVVRAAAPSEDFWNLWRERKEELKALGVSVGKNPATGAFEVALWATPDGKTPPRPSQDPGKAIVERVVEPVSVPDWVAGKLKPWQIPSVATLAASIAAHGAALDASSVGVGKTYIGVAVAATLGKRAIVLCPKAVIPGWGRCAKHFGVSASKVVAMNWEWVRTGKIGLGRWVKTTTAKGKEIEVFEWTLQPDDMIIGDEIHIAKSAKSQCQEIATAAAVQKIPFLALSATAVESPLDMKFLGFALGLYPHPSGFYEWLHANGCIKGRFGMEFSAGIKAPPDHPRRREACGKIMKDIHGKIFASGKGCRLRSDEIPGFPKTLIIPEVLDFGDATSAISGAYDEMRYELSRLDEVAKEDRQGVVLTAILRARQRSELLKVPTVVEMARELISEGKSVAIFVNFDQTIESLAALLKTRSIIRGERQGDLDRETVRVAFQENREHVIVANMQAGGVGLDLHDVLKQRERASLILPTYVPRYLRQTVGRINRTDGTYTVQKVLFAAGVDVEEQQAAALDRKGAMIDQFNDDDAMAGMPSFVAALNAAGNLL